jgi:hypothetical protein
VLIVFCRTSSGSYDSLSLVPINDYLPHSRCSEIVVDVEQKPPLTLCQIPILVDQFDLHVQCNHMYPVSMQSITRFASSPSVVKPSSRRRSKRESRTRSIACGLSSVTCQDRWRRGCCEDSAESETGGCVTCSDCDGTANLASSVGKRASLSLSSEDGGGHEGQRGVVVGETHGG